MTLTTTEELKHLASSDNANELTRRLARECLANREAQSVEIGKRSVFTCSSCGAQGLDEPLESRCHCMGDGAHWVESALYTAPPAPAVPDDLVAAVNLLLDCDGTRGHFSAIRCGDAREEVERLLAQPVSQGYTLQDGWIACSERMPDADGAYWGWFGKEKPSVIQQRVCIWNDRNHEWCDSSVTHWMPLPAAPEGGN